MEKIEILKIIQSEPDRIKNVKIKKYAATEFAESAYRVNLDGQETKYCYCEICKSVFSADTNHTLGNIRSHHNGHTSRKRVLTKTMDNFVVKKSKISVSDSEINEFRKMAARTVCESALPMTFFESKGAKTLMDGVQSK